MAAEFTTVGNGGRGHLVSADETYPVYVDTSGEFWVHFGGRWQHRPTMKAIDKIVKPTGGKVILVFSLSYPDSKPTELASLKAGRFYTADGRHHRSYSGSYVYDPDVAAGLLKLKREKEKAEKEFDRRYDRLEKKLTRVTATNFAELLEKVGVEASQPKKK